jgi:hypothetical protein
MDDDTPQAVGAPLERHVRPVEPERDARWALATEVARGRMAGGWVPVAADLVLALHDRLNTLAAEKPRLLDCRTCRHHTTATGGCVSVLRCIDGSAYQQAGVRQCWERA